MITVGLIMWLGFHLLFYLGMIYYRDHYLSEKNLAFLYKNRTKIWIIWMIIITINLWIEFPVIVSTKFYGLDLNIDYGYVAWLIFGSLLFITPGRFLSKEESKRLEEDYNKEKWR